MQYLAVFLLSILAAVTYGIIHDQFTARICVEYFTIAHPPVFATMDPTLLGIGWGIIATWWVGAILGVPLALAARLGRWPKRSAASLVKPIAVLLIIMACCAALAGAAGYFLGNSGWLTLGKALAQRIPAVRYPRFFADAFAHLASYGVGLLGGLVLVVWVIDSRRRTERNTGFPGSPNPSHAPVLRESR
jgi:hypothetical protein